MDGLALHQLHSKSNANFNSNMHSSKKKIIVSMWTCHHKRHVLDFLHRSSNEYFPPYPTFIFSDLFYPKELLKILLIFHLITCPYFHDFNCRNSTSIQYFSESVAHKREKLLVCPWTV